MTANDKEIFRYVYYKKRSLLPRKLTDCSFVAFGKVYYRVMVYFQSRTGHRYVRTDRLSKEEFLALKLREKFVISETELDRDFEGEQNIPLQLVAFFDIIDKNNN